MSLEDSIKFPRSEWPLAPLDNASEKILNKLELIQDVPKDVRIVCLTYAMCTNKQMYVSMNE